MSACHTDLGIENEREAGYYNRPWQWERIKANAGVSLSPLFSLRFMQCYSLTNFLPPYPITPSPSPPPSHSHAPLGAAGITQFHSDDDPFIPVREAQHVAASLALGARFHLLSGCSHFFSEEDAQPVLQAVISIISALK